ncbi:MAG TPA: hypothetical protein VJO33_03210 [Gemmatimonadaceae bacterium]|nr:hypothetical protein [Gemmatimonadaceae bacterium]
MTAALISGAIAAALALSITQPPGPGLDPDSASYLGAAQSLAEGYGYRIPISDWATPDSTSALSHFPPGYPTAIAMPLLVGGSPSQAARVVNASAAFVDVALGVWFVANVAGVIAGVALALAVLAMPPFLEVHLSILSEPLFLACMVGALVAMVDLSAQTDERRRIQHTFLAGLSAAAAMLTRYAGVAVVGAVLLWTLVRRGEPGTRVRRLLAAALPVAVLVGAWMVRVHQTSGAHAIRTLGTYGGFADTLSMAISTVVAWLVPLMSDQTLPGRGWIALALVIALVIAITRGARITRHTAAQRAIAATLMLAGCYVVVLVLSRLLADPAIPFDARILSPLFLLATIAAAIAISAWWRESRLPARLLAGAVLVAWFGASLTVSLDEASWALENGQDFAETQWTESPLLAWARANASHTTLYTNWPPAVFFHLHRTSHELPSAADVSVLRAFTDTVRVRRGIVLLFDQPNPDHPVSDTLLRAAGLAQLARLSDGTVLAPLRVDR